ncbi:MAG: DUF421 domain-containing protein [Acidobacteriota bacterium]
MDHIFGANAQTGSWWQMCLRATVVFAYLVLLIRVGERRTFGRFASFDIVAAVLLGTTLSRALTGNSPLGPTFAAAAVLVGLHWAVSRLAFRFRTIRERLEARPIALVRDGVLQQDEMRRAAVTEEDLRGALRSTAGTEDLSTVRVAYLERSGNLSFVRDGSARYN